MRGWRSWNKGPYLVPNLSWDYLQAEETWFIAPLRDVMAAPHPKRTHNTIGECTKELEDMLTWMSSGTAAQWGTGSQVSKFLRHDGPQQVLCDEGGWFWVEDVLDQCGITLCQLNDFARSGGKQRFHFALWTTKNL